MTFLAVLIAAALTFAMRASMLVLSNDRPLPAHLERGLSVVGPSVIAAMLTIEVASLGDSAPVDVSRLIAAGAALAVVARTRKMLHGAAVGMAVVWVGVVLGF